MKKLFTPQILIGIAWIQAIVALLGSLYYSNIELYVPCELCWWQRIIIYPQIIILGVALWKKNWKIYEYSLPLLIIGWFISIYHNIIYINANFIHPNSVAVPCDISGVSCTTRYLEYFGFVSIPLLSFLAITLMGTCMILLMVWNRKNKAK